MKRWTLAALLFLVSAFAAHYLTIRAVPGAIMSKVSKTFEEQGLPEYRWVASPRQTPETQRVVRPSPDLSYSVCRFDVSDGPVLVSAPGWDGYGSLSVFDDQTNNVFVTNLNREDGAVVLHRPDQEPVEENGGYTSGDYLFVEMSGSGIALIRRLAPTDEAHSTSMGLVKKAVCSQID